MRRPASEGSPMADLARLRRSRRATEAAGAPPADQTLPIEINTVEVPFTVNGERRRVCPSPDERLIDTLRHRLRLTAAQDACGDGACGACTVLLDGAPALACLVPTFQVRHRAVTTAEALDATLLTGLGDAGAGRCGACAAGVAATADYLRRRRPDLARLPATERAAALRELLAGHLCRCDYDGLVAAVAAALGDGD